MKGFYSPIGSFRSAPGRGRRLGPAIAVDLDSPRDRKAINHDPRFKAIRNEVIGYLTGRENALDGGVAATIAARARCRS